MNVTTGRHMTEVPKERWPIFPAMESIPLKCWMSNDYLAVLYEQRYDGNKRLTVNSTRGNGKSFRDGITWDELYRIKNECLGEDVWCIESYPSADKLVNVSNQRHLFIVENPPKERFPEASIYTKEEQAAIEKVGKMLIQTAKHSKR